MLPQKNNENVGDDGNLINRTPPERDFFKLDEINIPTPFKPEGVEGEDYWQSTQGGYYKMADDMGLEPILPPPPLPKINAFHPPRPSTTTDVTGRTAYESPGSRKAYADFMNLPDDSYAKELHLGQIEGESTSNLTAIELADTVDAISAKYEGSTTDASAEAELGEIIGAITSSYAMEDEGTDTGELSTRDLVTSSLYQDEPLNNQSVINTIFNKPDVPVIRNEPSLFVPNNFQHQIVPSVAKTENNMTVPITRDEKLTARYGQPYRRYGL
jgi:hypothetical protein